MVPTGLFLSSKKSSLLIGIVKQMLQERFNTIAITGPERSGVCQIYLQASSPSPAHFGGSKELLEKYLCMVEESQQYSMMLTVRPEIIDLISDDETGCSDDETSVIILDHGEMSSKAVDNSIAVIDLENSTLVETDQQQTCVIEDTNITREALIKETIVIDPIEKENYSLTKDLPVGTFNRSLQESNRVSKKRHFTEVDISDDEVILVDESSHSRVTTDINPVSNGLENVRVLLNGDNRTVSHETAAKTVHVDVIEKLKTSTTPVIIEIEDDEFMMPSNNSSKKKLSSLSYKRTAHLVDSLIKGTEGNSSDTKSDSNVFNPNANSVEKRSGLRPIVIDGNNVAISFGEFSLKRLQMCINYFEKRGHRQIKAFLPHHRLNPKTFNGLSLMERQGTVVFTPSRKVNGKVVASYDDRFIVQYATETGGIIVTTDNYRDLLEENPNWRETIDQRLLMFSWVDDILMFPQDPLGRYGPTLDEFLKFPD